MDPLVSYRRRWRTVQNVSWRVKTQKCAADSGCLTSGDTTNMALRSRVSRKWHLGPTKLLSTTRTVCFLSHLPLPPQFTTLKSSCTLHSDDMQHTTQLHEPTGNVSGLTPFFSPDAQIMWSLVPAPIGHWCVFGVLCRHRPICRQKIPTKWDSWLFWN